MFKLACFQKFYSKMLYLVLSCYILTKLITNGTFCHGTIRSYLMSCTERLADTEQGHGVEYSWRSFQTSNLGTSRDQLETPNT